MLLMQELRHTKIIGEMDKGAHISKIGNRRSKTLLYICAESARLHNKEIKLYYERRTLIDKKPRHYVLNAIANKLLRIIFTLVEKVNTMTQTSSGKTQGSLNIINVKNTLKACSIRVKQGVRLIAGLPRAIALG